MTTIYFSEYLKTTKAYQHVFKQISTALDLHHIPFELLPNTKDIWARDYMPIQVSRQRFVEYMYNPDYLQTTVNKKYITNTADVCKALGIETVKIPLVLDGGNVVKHQNKVILTDKVFKENKFQFSKEEVIRCVKDVLGVDTVIVVPWDKIEKYGHADGMVRFIDSNTVLTHGFYRQYSEDFKKQFYNAFTAAGLNLIELKFDVQHLSDDLNWGYINYLQTPGIMLVPVFGIDEDKQALDQLAALFPKYARQNWIVPIEMKAFVKNGGGALNCISWEVSNEE